MNDYDATLAEAVASAPGQENYRLHTPVKYPRLVHANQSGTIRILADAPGRFIVLRDGHVLHCGTPTECRTLYNELINSLAAKDIDGKSRPHVIHMTIDELRVQSKEYQSVYIHVLRARTYADYFVL